MNTEYNFTDKERQFFARHKMQFETAVMSGINLITMQNDLEGQWQMKPDGSGLQRVDHPGFGGSTGAELSAAQPPDQVNGMA